MYQLGIRAMQVTVDGNRITHNRRRKMIDGRETFDIIINNVNTALRKGIRITLRMNIDEENKDDVSEVLEEIEPEFRNLVYVSIANIFQNKEMISTYSLLRQAMQKGFMVHDRWNHYFHCHACLKNAIVLDTDGNILLCSNTGAGEKRMGYLETDGRLCMEREEAYYKIKMLSARENAECRDCVELPYCIAGCKYQRMGQNNRCLGKQGDGLSLKERALLDYYYDQLHKSGIRKVG